MKFRETARIQAVTAGVKVSFRRGPGYTFTRPDGVKVTVKARDLKAMNEVDFLVSVLGLDDETAATRILETEDRKTPPRFAKGSPERKAQEKAKRDRLRKRAARKAKKIAQPETVTVEINMTDAAGTTVDMAAAVADATDANTTRVVQEMAAEMGVTLG